MSFTLFKDTFKRSFKLLLIFACVFCLYLGVIISLIDPKDMTQVRELYGAMGGFMDAFGIDISAMTDPLAYTASTFYALIVMVFTMVFYVIQNMSLIAKPVDTGSMAYTLSMPISRTKVALTQGIYLIFAMAVHAVLMFTVGAGILSTMSDYLQENWFFTYLNLVAVTFLLTTMVAMLSYFFSVAFCDSKLGTGLAAGVPIALIVVNMLGGVGGEKTEFLTKLTPFGWLDSVEIVNGSVETLWAYLAFGGAIVVILFASAFVFGRKRLPI
ncbi:MAG: hypothetical protein RR681_01020 [Lachnospiraceae bacterium]